MEWISVKDRLPSVDGDYLVTIKFKVLKNYGIGIMGYAKNLYKVDEYDFHNKKRPGWYSYDSEYGYYENNDVVAWMELPEVYKEGE